MWLRIAYLVGLILWTLLTNFVTSSVERSDADRRVHAEASVWAGRLKAKRCNGGDGIMPPLFRAEPAAAAVAPNAAHDIAAPPLGAAADHVTTLRLEGDL